MNTMAIGIPEGAELVYLLLLLVLPAIFWIWTIVDCVMHEPEGNDKLVWLIVIVLIGIIGSLIYCLVRRPARIREQEQDTAGS